MSKTEKSITKKINKFNHRSPESFYEESSKEDYYQHKPRAFCETEKSFKTLYGKDSIDEQSKENFEINELPYINYEKTQSNKTPTVSSLKKKISELNTELKKLKNNSNVKNYNILELDYKLKTKEIIRLKQANNIYRFQINENKRDKYNFYKTVYRNNSNNLKKLTHKKIKTNSNYNVFTINQKPKKTIYSEHQSPKKIQTKKIFEKNKFQKKLNFFENLSKNLSTCFQIITKNESDNNILAYKTKCEEYINIINEKNNIIQNFEKNINKLEELNKTANNEINTKNKEINELELKIKILKQDIMELNTNINRVNNDKSESNTLIKLKLFEDINPNTHQSTRDFFSNMSLNQNDFQKKKIFFLLNEISNNFTKEEEYINNSNKIDSNIRKLLLANNKGNTKIVKDLNLILSKMIGVNNIKNTENNIKNVNIEKYIKQIKTNYYNDNNNTQESNGESNLNNATNQLNQKIDEKKLVIENKRNDNNLSNSKNHGEFIINKETNLKISNISKSKSLEDIVSSDGSRYNSNLIILGSEESKQSFEINDNLSQSPIGKNKKKDLDINLSNILNMRKNSSDISMTEHNEIQIKEKKIQNKNQKKNNKPEKNKNKNNNKAISQKKSKKEENNSEDEINQNKSMIQSDLYYKSSSNDQFNVSNDEGEEEKSEREEINYNSSCEN